MRTERLYTFEATKNSPHVAEFLQHIEIVLVFEFLVFVITGMLYFQATALNNPLLSSTCRKH